jgi:hypothetical protein
MGTQIPWGGSSGKEWNDLRDENDVVLDAPTDANVDALLPSLADALETFIQTDAPESKTSPPPVPAGPSWNLHPRGGGGEGGGGGAAVRGAGGGGRGGGGTTAGGVGGGRRSVGRVASVGGRLYAATDALQRGDAGALRVLGFDLAGLQAMSSREQINSLLNGIAGAGGDLEQNEIRAAAVKMMRKTLGSNLTFADSMGIYIVEYAMAVYASETSAKALDGSRPGANAVRAAAKIRSALTARVRGLQIESTMRSQRDIIGYFSSAVSLMRRLGGTGTP